MKAFAIAMILAGAVSGAAAQNLKPGLWEVQQKMQGNPELERQLAEARKQMAALPPEQRRQIEAMMAPQGAQVGPGGGSIRLCLTREMVERNEIPGGQGDCKVTRQQRSGSTVTAAFSCANPPSTGESQITFTSPESYRMRTTATTSVGGSAEKMTVEGSGRWLGADCGNVKPVGTPGN